MAIEELELSRTFSSRLKVVKIVRCQEWNLL